MQAKTTMRYNLTPVWVAIIKKDKNNKCWQGWKKLEPSYTTDGHVKMVQPYWKRVWQSLSKLSTELPYDPAIIFLGIYSRELKTYVCRKTCTPIFRAVLFLIAEKWKAIQITIN